MTMRLFFLCVAMAGVLSACAGGRFLAAPLNLYLAGKNFPSDQVAASLRTSSWQIFHVTDRVREGGGYGSERPAAMAFGAATVRYGTDLDIDTVRQRLQAERFSEALEQINLYINPSDAALRLSAYLTRSRRLGALKSEDFQNGELQLPSKQGLVHVIRVENVRGGAGHSCFRDNPAVLSDVVLALRTRAFPGGTLRPLEQDASGVWRLCPNYPLERLPDLEILLDRTARSDER
jgi:hypothetical protein